MIPGLSSAAESRILAVADATVTAARPELYAAGEFAMLTGRDAEAAALGVRQVEGPELTLVVTDPSRPIGRISVAAAGAGTLLFVDNRAWRGQLHATIRVLGANCVLIFNDIGEGGFVALHDVFLRSDHQFLFWGIGATAVGAHVEIEGAGQGLAVGDDALISNGVWIRNYNMHALFDTETHAPIGRDPVTTVLEKHVWLGQDALLLNCERIGTGAVVGARSLVNTPIPPRTAAAGTPARVIRHNVSWGRDTYAMTPAERRMIGLPDLPPR